MSLSDRIRAARKSAGLSQEELARRAGTSLNGVRNLEQGARIDPHYSTLSKLAKALNMSVAELMGEPVLAGKVRAPSGSKSPETGAGQLDPESAAPFLVGLEHHAVGLAGVWNQDVELYERDGRDLQPHRTYEMAAAVIFLHQQFWDVLGVLKQHAESLGLDPDERTWQPQSKQLLLEVMASISALAELYDLINRSAAQPSVDRESFRAMRQEFVVDPPAFLAEDPQWPEVFAKARATVGLT